MADQGFGGLRGVIAAHILIKHSDFDAHLVRDQLCRPPTSEGSRCAVEHEAKRRLEEDDQ